MVEDRSVIEVPLTILKTGFIMSSKWTSAKAFVPDDTVLLAGKEEIKQKYENNFKYIFCH